MKPTRRSTCVHVMTSVATLTLVAGLAACSSGSSGSKASNGTADAGGSTTSTTGLFGGGSQAKAWKGDPCSLLTAADFSKLSGAPALASTHANPNASSPDCLFQLQGSGAVHVFVDARSDFDTNKGIFKGRDISGIGSAAWRGDHDGQASDTIGVALPNLSYRVDSTFELKSNQADLVTLAKAVAAHLG